MTMMILLVYLLFEMTKSICSIYCNGLFYFIDEVQMDIENIVKIHQNDIKYSYQTQ